MLGERIGGDKGKVTLQRVLPNPDGPPRVETSFQSAGSLLGVDSTELGTYVATMRADGSVYGEGQGVRMSSQGDTASWVGQGVGTMKKDGSVAYRGAVYWQTASPKWSRLNSIATVFEYEVDAAGNTKSELFEWK